MTDIYGLGSSGTVSGGDLLAKQGAGGNRTRNVTVDELAEYINQIITGASIDIDVATNVITLTLGNGQIITGTVTA